MNTELSHIFEETGCLSEKQLLDYIQGRLDEHEMHRVEAHISGCDLCNDALEGLLSVENKEQVPVIIKQMRGQLRRILQSHRTKSRKVKFYAWLSTIIIVILLILLIAFFAIYYSMKKDRHPDQAPVQNTTAQVITRQAKDYVSLRI